MQSGGGQVESPGITEKRVISSACCLGAFDAAGRLLWMPSCNLPEFLSMIIRLLMSVGIWEKLQC